MTAPHVEQIKFASNSLINKSDGLFIKLPSFVEHCSASIAILTFYFLKMTFICPKRYLFEKVFVKKKLGAGILTRVAGSSCAGVADGQDSASKLWPLTATAGHICKL